MLASAMLHRVENTNSPQPELHPRDVCDVVDLAINVHLWLKSGVIDGERADIVLQKVVACLAEWRSVHRSSPLNHLSDAVQSSVDDLKSCILGDEADLASTNLQRLDLCSYAFFYQPNALPLAQIEFVLSSSLNTDSTADRQGLIDRLRGLTIEQILDGLGSYFFTRTSF